MRECRKKDADVRNGVFKAKAGGKGFGKRGLNSLEEEEEGKPEEEAWDQPQPWMLASLQKKKKAVQQRTKQCVECLSGSRWFASAMIEEEEDGSSEEDRVVFPLGRNDRVAEEGDDSKEPRPIYSLKTKYKEYVPYQVAVDSAAVECVLTKRDASGLTGGDAKLLIQGGAAKNGVKYVSADGGEIPNEGELDVDLLTREGHECGMTWQVADIQKSLLAVSALTKTGHEVQFRKNDGDIVNLKTGKKIRFVRRGDLFVLTMWMKRRKPKGDAGFRRQGP